MAAPPATPSPSDLTEYLHSQPDAYLVRNIYALQPTHELQAALASAPASKSSTQALQMASTAGSSLPTDGPNRTVTASLTATP
jgi:hypothetical protein